MSPDSSVALDREMLEEVIEGLSRPQKEVSPKYFYDTRGSELFERITELPEYYLTKVERGLLEEFVASWIRELAPTALVELGSGSSSKTRILIDAMNAVGDPSVFVPIDVSEEFLLHSARVLRGEYPGLRISPVVADLTAPIVLPADLPGPTLFALLGSTIGNFDDEAAVSLLGNLRCVMESGDAFLMGADLRPSPGKSVTDLEAAYNDSQGVTAEFNTNMLTVLNRELAGNFDPSAFVHQAFYSADEGRIEMHLVAREAQVVTLGDHRVSIARGESIRTELSHKYDRETVETILGRVGLGVTRWQEDERHRYALVWASVA